MELTSHGLADKTIKERNSCVKMKETYRPRRILSAACPVRGEGLPCPGPDQVEGGGTLSWPGWGDREGVPEVLSGPINRNHVLHKLDYIAVGITSDDTAMGMP